MKKIIAIVVLIAALIGLALFTQNKPTNESAIETNTTPEQISEDVTAELEQVEQETQEADAAFDELENLSF